MKKGLTNKRNFNAAQKTKQLMEKLQLYFESEGFGEGESQKITSYLKKWVLDFYIFALCY